MAEAARWQTLASVRYHTLTRRSATRYPRGQFAVPVFRRCGKCACAMPNANDPCPCGSGKKYNHCCLRRAKWRISRLLIRLRSRATHRLRRYWNFITILSLARGSTKTSNQLSSHRPCRILQFGASRTLREGIKKNIILHVLASRAGDCTQLRSRAARSTIKSARHSRKRPSLVPLSGNHWRTDPRPMEAPTT